MSSFWIHNLLHIFPDTADLFNICDKISENIELLKKDWNTGSSSLIIAELEEKLENLLDIINEVTSYIDSLKQSIVSETGTTTQKDFHGIAN